MAYPTNIDTIKKDWVNTTPVMDTHPEEHNLVGEVVESLQAKVGVNGSAVTTSHDYKLSAITGTDKASTQASVATVQTNLDNHEADLANPHQVTKTQVGLGNVTDNAQVDLTNNQTVGGIKTFSSSPIVPTPTTGTQVANKEYVDSSSNTAIQSNINCLHLPAYTSNQYVTSERFYSSSTDNLYQSNLLFPLTEIATANVTTGAGVTLAEINGVVEVGNYVYVHATQGTSVGNKRVLRYLKSDITASPDVMTISGQTFGTATNVRGMSYDGTYFLFPAKAFNSENTYIMSRYSLSGTTLTYVDDINLGSTAISSLFAFNGKYYTLDGSNILRRYSITGTLEYTRPATSGASFPFIYDAEDYKYFFLSRSSQLIKYDQISV